MEGKTAPRPAGWGGDSIKGTAEAIHLTLTKTTRRYRDEPRSRIHLDEGYSGACAESGQVASPGSRAVQPGRATGGMHEGEGRVEMARGVWQPGKRRETLKALFK